MLARFTRRPPWQTFWISHNIIEDNLNLS